MSEFNELNWKEALISVFERSMVDAAYRSLCLTDPIEAIKEVSEIELPTDFKIQFFGAREDYLYTVLLPPATANAAPEAERSQLIRWAALCTDPTVTNGPPL